MKKMLLPIAVFSMLLLPAQGVFAWEGVQSLNPMPYISYLNPLPYFGIGENKTSFSLNPFKGFKNCDPCKKVKVDKCHRVQKCDTCTGAAAPVCPKCTKAFPKVKCNSCQQAMPVYEVAPTPIYPTCPCQKRMR